MSDTKLFNRVTVLGVGLIGASLALAMKKTGLCGEIVGYGRNADNLKKAREMGIIDSFEREAGLSCKDSDLVVLSAPVGSFRELTVSSVPYLKKGAVVTDTGSVKGSLVHELEQLMPDGVNFIGAHPIAGSDRSGIMFSDAGLFNGAKCIITPTGQSDMAALSVVVRLWESVGCRVITMEPDRHDRIYASVSHFPHLIAYAMVNSVAETDPSYLDFSGQGFRDMTRIAASSHQLWRDICMMNSGNLIELISGFQDKLDTFKNYLAASDSRSLEMELKKAQELRESIGQN